MGRIRRLFNWFQLQFDKLFPIMLQQHEGDLFPDRIPKRRLVLLNDDGPYAAAMQCPCGCGETIELMIMEGVYPRWDIQADSRNRPTLHPSVWLKSGCRSHFWLKTGRVIWCKPKTSD